MKAAQIYPLELVILQGTNFCNIDCSYCYLSDRSTRGAMDHALIDRLAERLAEYPYLAETVRVVWHSGEPLTLGIPFYERAFELLCEERVGRPVTHTIQTNATLVSELWCELFQAHNVRVGVSIDGPPDIHDRFRKRRDGAGTHGAAIRGVKMLQKFELDLYCIAVVNHLDRSTADALYDFFISNNIMDVGINLAEIEGNNKSSGILADRNLSQVRDFYERFANRVLKGDVRFRWRELNGFVNALRDATLFSGNSPAQAARPGSILNVAVDGSFSTFSPELLGSSKNTEGLVFGNIVSDSFASMYSSEEFEQVWADISTGLEMCRTACEYWSVCRGGAPSNKLAENGTMASAATAYCRASSQTLAETLTTALQIHYPREVAN